MRACVRACVRGLDAQDEVPVELVPTMEAGRGNKAAAGQRPGRALVAHAHTPRAQQGSSEQATAEGAGARSPPEAGERPLPRCPLVP